ncbi:low molecular weight protein arginine phosphatase [Paenibacillus larvae]|uniref:Protein-tyrosine-phosphatase-like protein n=1 Tax=Paenibacillus larvae subsp. larvae TaxID=147375 RepID=A0A6C0QKM7_9BACL|nr:low molecular weight protein arginine phosphatase [Paenibacillus larvae]QHZ49274.1 protein-tyrosine-phosphatase-like protein [Paenibacillus larvae subsp. larvae]
MKRILFICTGNTCRSPLAEGILRKLAEEKGLDIEVRSAGVFAEEGRPISSHSAQILKEYGHEETMNSRQLNEQDVQWADLILTMTMGHKSNVVSRHPETVDKIYTLKEFVEDDGEVRTIIEEREKLMTDIQIKHSLSQEITVEEKTRIFLLENQLPSYDISDPFDGSMHVYKETAEEIKIYLEKLVAKLDQDKPESE